MKQTRVKTIVGFRLVAWVALVVTVSPAAATSWREALRHVPQTAALAIAVENPAEFSPPFLETELGQLLSGPVFAPFRDSLRESGIATILNPRPAWGLDWKDWAQIHDPVLITCFPLETGEAGWAGFVMPRQPLETAPEWLTLAKEHGLAHGWELSERGEKEWQVVSFSSPLGGNDAAGLDSSRWALFWGPERCGWVSDERLLEKVLTANAGGAVSSLREDPGLIRWFAEMDRQNAEIDAEIVANDEPTDEPTSQTPAVDRESRGRLYFVLKPFPLARTLGVRQDSEVTEDEVAEDELTEDELTDPWARAERLGLDRIGTVVGHVTFVPNSAAQLVLEAHIRLPRPLTGVLQLVAIEPGLKETLLPWLDPSMVATQSWRWDFPLAMQGWGALFDELTEPGPDGVGLFDDLLLGLRDDPTGPRVDLREDLFPRLGPICYSAWFRGDDMEAEGDSPRGLFSRSLQGVEGVSATREDRRNASSADDWLLITECRDEAEVQDLLERFYASDQQVTRQQQGDFVLWTVAPGNSLFVVGESEGTPTIRALASGRRHLLFATEPRLLDIVLEAGNVGNWMDDRLAEGQRREDDQPEESELREWLSRHPSEHTAWMGLYREAFLWQKAYEQARSTAGSRGDSRGDSIGDSWDVEVWRWLLYGAASEEARTLLHPAPSAEAWQHFGDHQGAILNVIDDQWQLHGALFPGHSPNDAKP